MAGLMKNAMSFLGMSDVVDEDDEFLQDDEVEETTFDDNREVELPQTTNEAPRSKQNPFQGRLSRITTIHPTCYADAQQVGRALRDGVPVVLNLTDVTGPEAFRIIDFASGVVFGIYGSIEQVTKRVFLLSPAQVSIVEGQKDRDSAMNLNLN